MPVCPHCSVKTFPYGRWWRANSLVVAHCRGRENDLKGWRELSRVLKMCFPWWFPCQNSLNRTLNIGAFYCMLTITQHYSLFNWKQCSWLWILPFQQKQMTHPSVYISCMHDTVSRWQYRFIQLFPPSPQVKIHWSRIYAPINKKKSVVETMARLDIIPCWKNGLGIGKLIQDMSEVDTRIGGIVVKLDM